MEIVSRLQARNVFADHPAIVANLRKACDQWWSEVLPALVNEDAIGPKLNPFKELYWKQFGGGPDAELRKKMDPTPRLNRAP